MMKKDAVEEKDVPFVVAEIDRRANSAVFQDKEKIVLEGFSRLYVYVCVVVVITSFVHFR